MATRLLGASRVATRSIYLVENSLQLGCGCKRSCHATKKEKEVHTKLIRHLEVGTFALCGMKIKDIVPISKVLIANRGEIACRVMQTARKMGVRSVACYSDADRNSMHTAMADEAYYVGPSPATESYLRMEKIIEIAKRSGAQAIHPGYGFLSEKPEFANLCEEEGIIFIGPPSSAITDMGIKSTSKHIMSQAGVPIIQGYHGDDQDDETLRREAEKIGYPVMLKAVRGGGGKGMRIVMDPSEFQSALDSARNESRKAFDDDKMLVEKFVERPRHVEVQVFADRYGNTVYLFERDCSVQRRHQKIIEEAPAPGLSAQVRREIGESAVRAAKAVGYIGAGTVEFIMDKQQNFYFMEMNTRLQVEHPITEMITGMDLVELQLRAAAGEVLPFTQDDLKINGHAFEARIYAEDPESDFLPGTGKLNYLSTPVPSSEVRVETGVRQGDDVSQYYDPMIAKLVVWDKSRFAALLKLRQKLQEYHIVGLSTNLKFLSSLASHPQFEDGDVHTGFIDVKTGVKSWLWKENKGYVFLNIINSPPDSHLYNIHQLKILNDLIFSFQYVYSWFYVSRHDRLALIRMFDQIDLRTCLEHYKELFPKKQSLTDYQLAQAAFGMILREGHNAEKAKVADKHSPFHSSSSFQMNVSTIRTMSIYNGENDITLEITYLKDGEYLIKVGESEFNCSGRITLLGNKTIADVDINGKKEKYSLVSNDGKVNIFTKDDQFEILQQKPQFIVEKSESQVPHGAVAPMTGTILEIRVNIGDSVKAGDVVAVIYAMKLEHSICSPYDGVVEEIFAETGGMVEQNEEIVKINENIVD